MKRFLVACAVTVSTLSAGQVLAEKWECNFTGARVNEWLRGQVYVTINGGNVTVFDSLINQVHGGPIPARVRTNNASRFAINWTLDQVKTNVGNAPRINYQLTYRKDRNRASFSANSPGLEDIRYPERQGGTFSSSGTCRQK